VDIQKTAETIIEAVKGYVARATASLSQSIEEIEHRVSTLEATPPPAGKDGEKGEDGAPGRDGRDGVDGAPGSDGVDGKDGKDGSPGADGLPGRDGADGASVDDVIKAVKPILDAALASWALDFERRAQGVLERAVDRIPHPKDGRDGRDGRDALDLDDFDLTVGDDGRTVTLSLKRGDALIQRSLSFPVVIDRGVFKYGTAYEHGDGVTFGGSFWIAQRASDTEKPGTGDAWRLAVKKGRDA